MCNNLGVVADVLDIDYTVDVRILAFVTVVVRSDTVDYDNVVDDVYAIAADDAVHNSCFCSLLLPCRPTRILTHLFH